MDSNPPQIGTGASNPLTLLKQWGLSLDIKVFSFSEVLEVGKMNPRPFTPPNAEDIFCLSYTSGTTGVPKGAILTHRNMISTVRAAATQVEMIDNDIHISYLPLAHIFERMVMLLTLGSGGAAGFFRGDGNSIF